MTFLKFNSNASSGGLVGVIAYTGSIQHTLGGLYRGGIRIFVLPVHQGFDAGLDNGFRAFITGEECYINRSALQGTAPIIQNRVQFRMGYVKILGVIGILLCLHFRPRENVVGATLGEAVVAHGENLMIRRYDAGTYLGRGILGTVGG